MRTVILFLLILGLIPWKAMEPSQAPAAPQTEAFFGKLPLAFEINQGQVPSQGEGAAVRFLARGKGYGLYLTPKKAILSLRQGSKGHGRIHSVQMDLVGANPKVQVEGLEKLTGVVNYYIGNDPSKWHTQVPLYTKVRLREVYPGIDMVYYGNEGKLEYDFVVKPGADPSAIRLAMSGTDGTRLGKGGDLSLKVDGSELAFQAPMLYQEKNGRRKTVVGRYAMSQNGQVGFQVDGYDPSQPLVIDPTLSYSTYLGGTAYDANNSIAIDGSGNAYLAGYTVGNFPVTPGAYQTVYSGGANGDAFVTKLNSSGTSLIYSTYLGGVNAGASAITVDGSGNAYVDGTTVGVFPTTSGAYQTTPGGNGDIFVIKLDPTGGTLLYSTLLGGPNDDMVTAIALDASGRVYVTGENNKGGFPTTAGAYQVAWPGTVSNVIVAKLNLAGGGASDLLYSTYIPGGGIAYSNGIAVDSSGDAYITGYAQGGYATTAGAFQTVYNGFGPGEYNAILSKLDPSGSSLLYSTYLSGGESRGMGIALDSTGLPYVVGDEFGAFPTTGGAYQSSGPSTIASTYAFISKINPAGGGASDLVYSTCFGGLHQNQGNGIALDGSGNVYITGISAFGVLPTTNNAFQKVSGGSEDAFVAKLDGTLSSLLYCSYLGGSGDDEGDGIALDGAGNFYLTGITTSSNFPTTTGAYQTTYGGGVDAFVAKFIPPDPTATATPTDSPTAIPTSTATTTPTDSMTATPSRTATATPSSSPTSTPTNTPTSTSSKTPTNTPSASPTGTFTPTPTSSPTSTPTWTWTPTLTPTPSSTPSPTGTPTSSPTITPTPTDTGSPTPSGYQGPNPPTPGTSFVYPSPVTGGTLNIAYTMRSSGTVKVLVWNESAELVAQKAQPQGPGPQKTTLAVNGWAPGVYFYRVVLNYSDGTGERLAAGKFLVGWW